MDPLRIQKFFCLPTGYMPFYYFSVKSEVIYLFVVLKIRWDNKVVSWNLACKFIAHKNPWGQYIQSEICYFLVLGFLPWPEAVIMIDSTNEEKLQGARPLSQEIMKTWGKNS